MADDQWPRGDDPESKAGYEPTLDLSQVRDSYVRVSSVFPDPEPRRQSRALEASRQRDTFMTATTVEMSLARDSYITMDVPAYPDKSAVRYAHCEIFG